MKNKFNTLQPYIFEYREREYRKETINGLFRSILEPLIANQKVEALILLRLLDRTDKESSIKRLTFSGTKIFEYDECSKEDIWGNTEFIIVLGQRYSAALIWDYSSGDKPESSKICQLYNSKIISDIAKVIDDNSKEDLKEYIQKYQPDRRENMILNQSISAISSKLNDKNEEYIFSQKEKTQLENSDETIKTAEIVAEKAKFIAHEIKNNLSIVNVYAKILEKRSENVKGNEETITSINNAIRNINTASENVSYLISDLRCLSTPYKTEINVVKIIQSTIEMCEPRTAKAKCKIHFDKRKNIFIEADKVKIECALTNIIFNAADAGAENIFIEIISDKKEIKIIVKNDGKEIEEENLTKIFEENFTTKEKGNGLGLAFCKKQMQITGGDLILLYSNEKETAFEIEILK